ncbi:MAG TPA: VOC family protein [Thermoanaerobaculia bacterium]|jgi:catechol 2,3-dioxygenase-like lactoylglutathione lyase family enzyme|nr:VOC family protein [Thermoanaerobaculia bacterium]
MKTNRIWWTVICALLALAGQGAAQGLGDGRGIDHVASLVRLENFDAAASVLTDQLGFSVTPALLSPVGAKNRLIWFSDLSYLEVDTFTERNDFTAPFVDFLDHHEGAKFYGTEVVDAAQAITFLTGAGYPNVGPIPAPPLTIESTGQVFGLTPLWNSIILTARVAPDNSNFFLDYDEAQVSQMFVDFPALAPRPHANTAQKIDTLWLVVSDLDAAIDFYEGLGLEVGSKHKKIQYLGGRGAEVRYKNATLALLEPDGPGVVADFAADRGEGILGVSLKAGNLHTALSLVNRNTGLNLRSFKYKGRDRFLIPASLTHGFLIEMVE